MPYYVEAFEDLPANEAQQVVSEAVQYANALPAQPAGGGGGSNYASAEDLRALYLRNRVSGGPSGGPSPSNYSQPSLGGGGGSNYNNFDPLRGLNGYSPYASPQAPAPQAPAPPPAPHTLRPMAPGGLRQAVTQSAMGQTRQVIGMVDSGYTHDRTHPVQYMEAAKAKRYVVEIGRTLTRRGLVFDTGEIKKAYVDKFKSDRNKYAAPGSAGAGLGLPQDEMRRWGLQGLIWVCASEGAGTRPVFYSGVGKLNKVHHSSFTGGDSVVGAGEWMVEQGELTAISAVSGHYLPTMDALYASVLHMAQAFTPKTTVLMYDTRSSTWEYRPVKAFITAPSNGGQYKVHPMS